MASIKSASMVLVLALTFGSFMLPGQSFWDRLFPPNQEIEDLQNNIQELEQKISELDDSQPLAGPQGEQGYPGVQGESGLMGPEGPQGEQGIQGPEGEIGTEGEQGPPGPPGSIGPQGARGFEGSQGPRGEQGDTGSTGPTGPQGVTGIQGPAGLDGEPVIPDDKIPDVKVYLESISAENELDVSWYLSYGPSNLVPSPILPVNGQEMIITGGQINPYAAYFTLPNLITGTYTLWVTGSIYGDDFTSPVSISVREEYANIDSLSVYWDSVSEWDGKDGKLQVYWGSGGVSTNEASVGDLIWVASGETPSHGASFIVPESQAGNHYIWFMDIGGNSFRSDPISVVSSLDLSRVSGSSESQITVEGHGFGKNRDIMIGLFEDYDNAPVGEVILENSAIIEVEAGTEYTLETSFTPIKIGSFTVTDGVETFTDNGDYSLTGNLGGNGYVDYVTGEIYLVFDTEPLNGAQIQTSYDYYQNAVDEVYIWTGSRETNTLGSYSAELQLPLEAVMATGNYELVSFDNRGNMAKTVFNIN